VASAAGVSPASVSLVLNGAPGPSAATRARVLEVATALGYRADRTASLLARRRRHLLGVMIDIRNSFHAELVEAIQANAEQRGYDVVLSTLTRTRDERRAVETLLDFRCEALILLGPTAPKRQLAALALQLPVIVIGRRIVGTDVDVVRTADQPGLGQVVDHLVALGHERIAYVDGGKGTIATDRRRGYILAMRRHRLSAQQRVVPGGQTEDAGTHAATELLQEQPWPTAVIAFNDRSALGLLDALIREGVDVPGEMSVVGYDDSPPSRLAHVNLSTVSQNPDRQAEHAVVSAVERLDDGRTEPRAIVLDPQFVVRGTTGPARTND
jgi:DNA-binding LacI/PurR family transcriptional regulator